MILKQIAVLNLGEIDAFEYHFEDGMNLLRYRYTDELLQAIQLALGHKKVCLSDCLIRANTEIRARVRVKEKEYSIIIKNEQEQKKLCIRAYGENGKDLTKEYLYLTSHSLEQDLTDVFCGNSDKNIFKLLQYLDEDRYYSPKELATRTKQLSETKIFRTYLKNFIKDFEPELIREGKWYELFLDKNGKYGVRYKGDDDMPVHLSETEQMIFNYLCFLRTAEFWQNFEELRNIHSIKKPILVKDFLERLDRSIDIEEILGRKMRLNRQIVILTR